MIVDRLDALIGLFGRGEESLVVIVHIQRRQRCEAATKVRGAQAQASGNYITRKSNHVGAGKKAGAEWKILPCTGATFKSLFSFVSHYV